MAFLFWPAFSYIFAAKYCDNLTKLKRQIICIISIAATAFSKLHNVFYATKFQLNEYYAKHDSPIGAEKVMCVYRILHVCASQLCTKRSMTCAGEPKIPVKIKWTKNSSENLCNSELIYYIRPYHLDFNTYSLNAKNGDRIL